MPNVIFKRGLQANLDAVAKQDGVFYLTTDTHRLYADINNERRLLNQTVQIVPNLEALTTLSSNWSAEQQADHVNDFYYVTGSGENGTYSNILVVWTERTNGSGYEWRQINADHNAYLTAASIAGDVAGNIATITVGATDSDGNDPTGTMTITASGGLAVSDDNNGNLTITGDTYTLGKAVNVGGTQATISLSSTNNSSANSDVKLVAGSSNVQFADGANGIEISVEDSHLTNVAMSVSEGSLTTTVTDYAGNDPSGTVNNIGVIIGASGDHYLPINSTSGKTLGSVYTKEEVDRQLRGLDGMTYKGTLGSNGTGADINVLPTTEVKNGDTYVIRESNLMANSPVFAGAAFNQATIAEMANGTKVGDMVIAKGTEDTATGYIGNNLTWTYIPAGNDSLEDVTYHGESLASDNSLSLKNVGGTSVAKIALTAGTNIAISSDASDSTVLNATISHGTISTSTTAASVLSNGVPTFTAIKELTVDNGHVTAITTDTFTPIAYSLTGPTGANGQRFNTTTNVGTNDSSVVIKLHDDTNTDDISTISLPFNSSSIKLTSNTATGALTMDLEWGTF